MPRTREEILADIEERDASRELGVEAASNVASSLECGGLDNELKEHDLRVAISSLRRGQPLRAWMQEYELDLWTSVPESQEDAFLEYFAMTIEERIG